MSGDELRALVASAYASGYMRGHNATVEGGFIPVDYVDYPTYFEEEAEEIIAELRKGQG